MLNSYLNDFVSHLALHTTAIQKMAETKKAFSVVASRAANGARTHDPQLGKLMLYQLSYCRTFSICKFANIFSIHNYNFPFYCIQFNPLACFQIVHGSFHADNGRQSVFAGNHSTM